MRRIGISRSTSARLIRAAMAMFLAAGAFLPSRAWAYDGVTSFQVSLIELGGTDRSGFKLVNPATGQAPALCNADASGWGIVQVGILGATQDFLNRTLAIVMTAKLSGATLTVYAWNPTAGSGNCVVAAVDLN